MQETCLKVIYSQNLEALAEEFVEAMPSESSAVFEARVIVVPHLGMKEFLMHYLAHHPRLRISSGLQILPLHQAVMEIVDRSDLNVQLKKIPSFFELTLAIQEQLLRGEEDDLLKDYLQTEPLRIVALAEELAKAFTQYGLFGKQFLSSWLQTQGWQQTLWKRVFTEWNYPLAFFSELKEVSFQGNLTLFGFSYLPGVHLHFFSTLGAQCYLFSPCALFWEDVVSDKERLRLERAAQHQGVSCAAREQLQQYMKQSHPLLASWGRMGKQMLKELQRLVLDEKEAYVIPSSDRLLTTLQRSILLFDEESSLQGDDSIQVHSAPSRLREVEAMRDTLETLLEKGRIFPGDVVVVAPQLSLYAPLIEMIFKQSSLPYYIETEGALSKEVRGLFLFLELPRQRYSLKAVAQLLECISFKEGFSGEEIELLISWFKLAQIHFDLSGHAQCWQEGLDRLLYGLSQEMSSEETLSAWPLACIPHSEMALFGRFLELFNCVQQALQLLKQDKSLPEWIALLLQWQELFFFNQEAESAFFSQLRRLQKSPLANSSSLWSFEHLYPLLQQLVRQQRKTAPPSAGRILFSSTEGAAFKPAKAVWCLGMDEESFPGVEVRSSLCTMKGLDEFPSQSDQDRFGFLELVMKAKEFLFFSYERVDQRDGKEKGPSLLIEELNSYVRQRGVSDGIQTIEHPANPFEARYFSSSFPVKRWRSLDYAVAQSYYAHSEERKSFFSICTTQEKPIVTVAQLRKCARHPLQLYLNETLQLFLQEDEDEEEADFLFSALNKSILRKGWLQETSSGPLCLMKAQGKLPFGGFARAAESALEEEHGQMQKVLEQFQLEPKEVHTVHFVDCQKEESSLKWHPLLRLTLEDGRCISIQGSLDGVTERGLVFFGTTDLADLIKVWPLYLLYLQLYPDQPVLLLTKEGVKLPLAVAHPEEELRRYMTFYLQALQRPCPFIPSYVKTFYAGDEAAFKVLLEKQSEDEHLNYIKRRGACEELVETFSFWQPQIQALLKPLMEAL